MRKHGQQRAERYVLELISRVAGSGATALPSVRSLARSAEVSALTMQRAIHTLRTRGLVDHVHGSHA